MPTAITHFKFKTLPDPNAVDSKINAVTLVVDTLYPIADENLLTFERTSRFDDLSLETPFLYKVVDNVNNLESNEALIRLGWKGVSANPASSNVSQVINNLDVINLLDTLPLNDVTEWIEIIFLIGIPGLLINGIKAQVGRRLTILDLYYSDFTALAEGGGDPYFQLGYKVGEDNTAEITIYTLDLDIVSLAIIGILTPASLVTFIESFDTGGGLFVDYTVKEETTIVEVSKGHVFGIANITIAILSPFLALNQWNSVTIDYNGIQTEYFANTTVIIAVKLDKLGKGEIEILNTIVFETADPAVGEITITVDDINGDSALVDGVQIQQVLTNL